MLVMRREQIEMLSESVLRVFEEQMAEHCREFSPRLCNVLGEEQLGTVVRRSINTAEGYGITHRGPVRLYLEMIFLFGSDFATDPQYPWAREILTGKYHGTQMERAGKLYRQTLDYLEQIAGPGDCHTRNALERISVIARQPLPVSRENFLPDAVRLMQWLYPEKAAHVGKKGLGQVIRKAVGEVSSCGMSTIHNAMIFPP